MIDGFKVLEIKQNIFDDNNRQADILRVGMKQEGIFMLNLMSSPGSGKTTTVVRTIEALKDEMKIGVVEADVDSDVDAFTVANTGTRVIQLHTGGMCHLDAGMVTQGLSELQTNGLDFVILENIGNLLCPAEFDTGAAKNAMILSVPEGDDKPLKYPLMFSKVDVLLINKIDAMEFFNFDLKAASERVKKLNPAVKIFPVSAKTGEGISEWVDWIRAEVKNWKNRTTLD